MLADNKLAENASWDRSMLRLELKDLQEVGFDLDVIGFSDEEFDALMKAVEEGEDGGSEEPEFTIAITSKDEGEIIALRKLLGVKKSSGRVSARAVLALIPSEM